MTEKIIALTAEHLGIDADSISETSSFKEVVSKTTCFYCSKIL